MMTRETLERTKRMIANGEAQNVSINFSERQMAKWGGPRKFGQFIRRMQEGNSNSDDADKFAKAVGLE